MLLLYNKSNMMEGQYDVENYSNAELIQILGLINPSDRELEAKLVEMIRRYSFIRTSAGKQMYAFFVGIYDRFFEEQRDNDDEEPAEGFTTMGTTPVYEESKEESKEEDVSLIQQLEYTTGKLNPILKETYKRTISIDSQYRDEEYVMSTDFGLSFTETLKDVVSLKLYAIQLPVTWYTINENYGSNFFYLKSSSTGIDNENHEYRIEVPAGNYSPSTLQETISQSFQELRRIYQDVNFGTTGISYNTANCRSTITIDIQKVYNEHYYELHFEKPASDPGSLAMMLGFKNTSYDNLFSVYSKSTASLSKLYNINSFNRKISIVQYNSRLYTNATLDDKNYDNIILEYQDFQNISSESQTILVDTEETFSSITTIEIALDTASSIDISGILENINLKIQNEPRIDEDSYVYYDHQLERFVWKIKLNRNKVQNIPNSKTVLLFPYDATETDESKMIWVDTSINSGFGFKSTLESSSTHAVIELSNQYSEEEKITSFDVDSYEIRVICIDPNINPNINDYDNRLASNILPEINSKHDFKFSIDNSDNYVQTTFKDAINRSLSSENSNNIHSRASFNNNQFKLSLNISNTFDTSNFISNIDGVSGPILDFPIGNNLVNILSGVLKLDRGRTNKNPGTNTYVYDTDDLEDFEKGALLSNYTINANETLFTIVNTDGGTLKDITFSVVSESEVIASNIRDSNNKITKFAYQELEDQINNIIHNYQFDEDSSNYPLSGSSISITRSTTNSNRLNVTMIIDINFEVTEKSYRVEFIDPENINGNELYTNTVWYSAFKLDISYELQLLYTEDDFIEISGPPVELDTQLIQETLTLKPRYSSIGGVYVPSETNDIKLTIDTVNPVTRDDLIPFINDQLKLNERTRGSYFELQKDGRDSRTKVRWNINKIFTSGDYRIVFYDIYSFVKCSESTRSYKNATIDNTLGWILGFRKLSEYPLIQESLYTTVTPNTYKNPETLLSTGNIYTFSEEFINNTITNNPNIFPSNVITTLKGDTTVSVNLYNYFMIILDDFNQNHLNDGLVTVTKRDNSVTLPSYANRKKYTCDPLTGDIVNSGVRSGSNNLTQNQLYSLNQIINTQNRNRGETNSGPFIKDMFALLPVKTSGMTPGSIFVEYGGTLQNQERTYFGPVNINRMHIKLINDRGDVVDLNGANWSIQLVCEQLYQQQKSS